MASPQPGWYPDPSGNTAMLRYWDGTQWTDNCTPAQQLPQSQTAQPYQQYQQYGQGAQQTAQPYGYPGVQAGYQQASTSSSVTVVNYQAASAQPTLYPMTDTDRTLRLIAFILNLLVILSVCWIIIPLAWTIPMTVHSWGIYKGKKPNTVAFGVCTLLFMGIISGILLLCSHKDD